VHGVFTGLRLWETGTLAPRCSPFAEAAQPHLMELHARTSAGALLVIRDRVEGLCLSFAVNGPHALMSWTESGDQNEVCAGPLRTYTPTTPAHGPALRQALAKIRREGCAVTHRTPDPDCSAVAFPVRTADGTVVAAVGVVAQADTFRPAKPLPLVSATAGATA
jgi:DNA-binding IclR family transcriptional regulator